MWLEIPEWSANVTEAEWEAKTKRLLKAELKRRGVIYAQLVES
jgi:hypothetical protein